MTELADVLNKFVQLYHDNTQLVQDYHDWTCTICLVANDSNSRMTLQIVEGKVENTNNSDGDADLIITTGEQMLLDILELRLDPNEPYLFGELTVQGPEEHFLKLDYIVTMLCLV